MGARNLTTLGTGWVPGDLNERGEVTGQALVDNQFVAITWSRQTGGTRSLRALPAGWLQ